MPDYENDIDGGWDRWVDHKLDMAGSAIGIDGNRVHGFESAGAAYDMTQCDDRIKDGDILVVKSAGIVGILYDVAWPVALTKAGAKEWGAFVEDFTPDEKYAGQIEQAIAIAKREGFELQERFA